MPNNNMILQKLLSHAKSFFVSAPISRYKNHNMGIIKNMEK